MRTGLIIPTTNEAELIDKKLFGEFHAFNVCGMGGVRASYACSQLIHMRKCDRIALIGFAGGLNGLREGDIVEPNLILDGDLDASHLNNEDWEPDEIEYSPMANIPSKIECPIISQNQFLLENPYDLFYPKLATDMESYAVAYFCQENMIPLTIIRVISDIVGEDSVAKFGYLGYFKKTLNEVVGACQR